MSDAYRMVEATVKSVTKGAFTVETVDGHKWIPRSLIHAADDARVEVAVGTKFTFRLRAWKAEELGLTGA